MTNILKGLFRHTYIEKGQINCFNFSFLGWGLKVTYNSDIFEKLRAPPPWVFKCLNLNFRRFVFFLTSPLPPILEKLQNLPVFRGASLSRSGHVIQPVSQPVSQSVRDALVKFCPYKSWEVKGGLGGA